MDWLRTVIELTDPMIARQAIEDAETIDRLDFELLCQCLNPDLYCTVEPHEAAFYIEYPCGDTRPICAAAADLCRRYALCHNRLQCRCGEAHEFVEVILTPITGKQP